MPAGSSNGAQLPLVEFVSILGVEGAGVLQKGRQAADLRKMTTPLEVLVLMDNPVLAEVVRLALSHGKVVTRAARNQAEASALLAEWRPHLAFIDIDVGWRDLLNDLPADSTDPGIPLIALTRRGDLQTKLAAFDGGADDILVVPFSPDELVARTRAIIRRTFSEAGPFAPVIRVGELEIDILHRRANTGANELHLTALELSLLYLLAGNAGRLMTRDEILDELWGVDYVAESNVVDRQVRKLRVKLKDGWRKPRFIATVPGRGYRFLPAVVD